MMKGFVFHNLKDLCHTGGVHNSFSPGTTMTCIPESPGAKASWRSSMAFVVVCP
ncbi:MAG: hypothetical protein NT175_03220 [Bacteroidetes bacterium]|nr:hypothetical protein [Bacteroidota bacterium]